MITSRKVAGLSLASCPRSATLGQLMGLLAAALRPASGMGWGCLATGLEAPPTCTQVAVPGCSDSGNPARMSPGILSWIPAGPEYSSGPPGLCGLFLSGEENLQKLLTITSSGLLSKEHSF